ncbi:MAG: hypothetical protein K2Y37_08130 [Pirellulales bacterium]|nr:hypothetical protein [Pirellulales bacterium]
MLAQINQSPVQRPWYRPHVSTLVVALAAATWLAMLNLSIEVRYEYDPVLKSREFVRFAGWPYRFWQWRLDSPPIDAEGHELIWPVFDDWFKFSGEVPVAWGVVLANVAVATLLAAAIAGSNELWRRRRSRFWQFRLLDLLIATTLIALGFVWIRAAREEASHVARRRVEFPMLVARVEGTRPSALWSSWAWSRAIQPQYIVSIAAGFYPGSADEPLRLSMDDLQRLRRLSHLRGLYLPHHDSAAGPWPVVVINDAGLEHLGRLKRLEYLALPDHPGITDAGLPNLAPLTRLKFLNLRGTSVTSAGVARLQRQIPYATIEGP